MLYTTASAEFIHNQHRSAPQRRGFSSSSEFNFSVFVILEVPNVAERHIARQRLGQLLDGPFVVYHSTPIIQSDVFPFVPQVAR